MQDEIDLGATKAALECVVQWDVQGRILEANPAFARLVGLEAVQFVGHLFSDYLNASSVATLQNLKNNGGIEPVVLDLDVVGKPCLASIIQFPPAGKEMAVAVAFLCERQFLPLPVQDMLRSYRLLEALQEVSQEVILIADEASVLRYVSPSVQRVLGFGPEEYVGRMPDPYYSAADRARVREEQHLWAGQPGRHFPLVRHMMDRSGTMRTLEGSAVVLRDQPYLNGMVLCVSDITEKDGMRQRMEESRRLEGVGRLAGGVAHDFNNVLTVIQGQVELMIARNTDPRMSNGLMEVRQAAQRASGLVSKLLAFGRRSMFKARATDLRTFLLALQPSLERFLGASVGLDLSVPEGLRPVMADPSQMENVILALVSNARDAMPQGGHLSISVASVGVEEESAAGAPVGDYLRLDVVDNGVGMDDTVLRHAFEPFFSTKSAASGKGMGLASCFGIMKQSGGHIELKSQEGRGARVSLWWPLAPPDMEPGIEAPSEGSEGDLQGHDQLVLVVDDEMPVLEAVSMTLRALGYRVKSFQAPELALDWLSSGGRPALLITDMVMPNMGGEAFAGKVQAQFQTLPVLYMSGFANIATGSQWLRSGINFLPKPFASVDLAKAVQRILAGAQA